MEREGKVVLVVDDNREVRAILRKVLAGAGYEVIEADGGAQAVAESLSHQPDLILMDLEMPYMNGWQAAELIRADPATEHIRIIAISGHDVFRGSAELFADSVAKPIPNELLLSVVRRHLVDMPGEGEGQDGGEGGG